MVVRALRVGALFLPVVCPWAREGDRAALIALYEATEGAGWATNAEYAGDDPYYNQSWIGGNNFWNVIDPSRPSIPLLVQRKYKISSGTTAAWQSCRSPFRRLCA